MFRIFGHYIPKTLLLLGSTENFILLLSVYFGMAMGMTVSESFPWMKIALYCLVMLVMMISMGMYQKDSEESTSLLIIRVMLSFFLGGCTLTLIYTLFPQLFIGTNVFLFALGSSFFGILTCRMIWHFRSDKLLKQKTLVIGAGKKALQLENLRNVNESGIKIVGFVDIEGKDNREVNNQLILDIDSDLSNLTSIIKDNNIKEIVIALDERRKTIPIDSILDCKMNGVRVIDVNTFLERQLGKICVNTLQPSGLIFSDGFVQNEVKSFFKRLFDVSVSVFILLLTFPIMLLAMLAILIESNWKGSVFYKQERVGLGNKPFNIYKLRSMREDAEAGGKAVWAKQNDDRITAVGHFIRKTRIDELPQLINVLRGDMSFVGPRPERPEFVEDLNHKIPYYTLRHHIKPGITGWAQICYPYGASVEDSQEKLQYDLYYLKNNTIFLDLLILMQTAAVILLFKGR